MVDAMDGAANEITIERQTEYRPELVEPLFDEFLSWGAGRLERDYGVQFDDRAAMIDAHHDAFRQQVPNLVGPRGRLLVARVADLPVGVVALKPVDDTTAEVKRMFVRPAARGLGIGRALLERLLADARDLGYRVARLETLRFMTEAQALYRSLGFADSEPFESSEAAEAGVGELTVYMRLGL